MQQKADGQNYAPKGKSMPVCAPGEFPIGVISLDHGHIYGMCNGLIEAGATLKLVWDPDPAKLEKFLLTFPQAQAAQSEQQVLEDAEIKLVASAGIPACRAQLGLRVMQHGKDYFCDKPAMISMEEVAQVRRAAAETGRKYGVYFSERLHVEASVYAQQLLEQGAIGRVVQVSGFGPHRASVEQRPDWFFDKAQYGGILTDIGCHQIEQILFFSGAKDAKIGISRTANYAHKQWQSFEDFGEVSLLCDNGASGYFRVDWFTPDGLGAWGDGRTVILGTEGYIELRKYLNVATQAEGDHVFLVNHEGEFHYEMNGKCGFPFFGRFIRDCLDRTETAMEQEYALHVMELAIQAQQSAQQIEQ